MTTRKFMRGVIGAGAIGIGVWATSSATAGSVNYPGTWCRFYGKQASDTFFDVSGGKGNSIKNTSSAVQTVACPAMHQDDSSRLYSGIIGVSGPNANTTTCTLQVRPEGGGLATAYNPIFSCIDSSHCRLLWNQGIPMNISDTLAFVCDVPPGVSVLNYTTGQ